MYVPAEADFKVEETASEEKTHLEEQVNIQWRMNRFIRKNLIEYEA